MIAFAVSLFGLSMPFGFWLSHYSPWRKPYRCAVFYVGLGAGLTLLAVILIVRFRVVLARYEGRRIASQGKWPRLRCYARLGYDVG